MSDSLTGAELEVTAQVIVNAAGAAAGNVLGMLVDRVGSRWSRR